MMNTLSQQHLVVGAGATGWSIAQYLHERNIPFRVVDSRVKPPFGEQFHALLTDTDIHFGDFEAPWFDDNDCIVLSPGVSLNESTIKRARDRGKKIIGDVELFALSCAKPYIAITGSNGKSTVTAMAEKMLVDCGLNAIAGANYGTPALDLLNHKAAQWYVLELSSFQLETTCSLKPDVSVLLNVTDDHLDRHVSYEEYRDIKKTIFNHARVCLVNRDQHDLLENLPNTSVITFGSGVPSEGQFGLQWIGGERYLMKGATRLMRASQVGLAGEHGLMNALAVFAAGDALKLEHRHIADSIATFQGLPFRCELIFEHNDVHWYNDSKGTNIGATLAAVTGLSRRLVLIVGGVFKGGSLEQFKRQVAEKVDCVIAFGRDKQVFEQLLSGVVTVRSADGLESAIRLAEQHVQPGQAVLFSPACASFDMFDNYIHRGHEFNRLVNALYAVG